MTSPAPLSAAASSSATPSLVAPHLGRRMACWLYEGMLMFGVVFLAGYLFSSLTQTRHALDNRHPLQAFLFVVFAIYFTWFWAKGQTLAQKTWNIRVVDALGRPASQTRTFARYLLSWLWLLPPLALGSALGAASGVLSLLLIVWVVIYALLSRLHAQKQFVHDALAGTRLVHFEPPPRVRKPA